MKGINDFENLVLCKHRRGSISPGSSIPWQGGKLVRKVNVSSSPRPPPQELSAACKAWPHNTGVFQSPKEGAKVKVKEIGARENEIHPWS